MMSKYFHTVLIGFFLFLFQIQSFGQLVSPPKWTIQLAEKDLKVGQEAEIVLKASIPMNWYIYSNDFDEKCGTGIDDPVLGWLQGDFGERKT
jgi:hypothetical protein